MQDANATAPKTVDSNIRRHMHALHDAAESGDLDGFIKAMSDIRKDPRLDPVRIGVLAKTIAQAQVANLNDLLSGSPLD